MSFLTNIIKAKIRIVEFLSPLFLLATRLWVAWAFWKSGMTKIASLDSTILLFKYEYKVPLLSPEFAAYLGTATEIIFPPLLALGLGGRFAAFVLFIFNIIAVISYPTLNPVGVQQHYLWGFMLLVIVFYGPGKVSIDHFLRQKYMPAAR